MILELKDIKATYKDGFTAIEDLNVSINEKSFVVLLGESGSGKTTLFKIITGLLDPIEGSVSINDKDVTNLLTESRDISMIFQNFALYPHMTIYQNVMTALNGFDIDDDEKDLRAKQILKEFGLSSFLNFKPRHLSDGQKQRVAMCKALVREPSIFLMDEPLSNLDTPQRNKIKNELKEIYSKYNTSFIYITHDVRDAENLGTIIWLMHRGKILQTGTITEIRKNPKTLKCFELVTGGEVNTYNVKVKDSTIIHDSFSHSIKELNKEDKDYIISFSYRDVYFKDDGEIKATFKTAKIAPKGVLIEALLNDKDYISFYVSNDEMEDLEIKEGDTIRLQLKTENVKFFKLPSKSKEIIG